MNRIVGSIVIAGLLIAFVAGLGGCIDNPLNLINPDCFASGALTQDEYDDLSAWEQLLYTKNSCDLYVKSTIGDLFD